MRSIVLAVAAVAAVGACGGGAVLPVSDAPPALVDAPPGVVDERVPTPTPSADYLDLFTPEETIAAGEEKQLCVHLRNTKGALAIDSVNGMQGVAGHHIALFTSSHPQPPGTVVDCTSGDANADMEWFAFNVDLPRGDAIQIPENFPFVIQFHYLNATDNTILIRDVERLHVVPVSSVQTWISTMILTDLQLAVTPGASTVTWDCKLPADTNMIEQFGHMHDQGAAYSLQVGTDPNALTTLNTVSPWQPYYRDHPRVTQWFGTPQHYAAGTIMRTTCAWDNAKTNTLQYPDEMCITFAYIESPTQYQCQPPTGP
ncbi:MAG TPA: hypothetical protein VH165_11020 [Kofleriaceae bacterium]|jgi:hypothetical protein|nr:hypothetical protein [Kofleriaceae bacterium]